MGIKIHYVYVIREGAYCTPRGVFDSLDEAIRVAEKTLYNAYFPTLITRYRLNAKSTNPGSTVWKMNRDPGYEKRQEKEAARNPSTRALRG